MGPATALADGAKTSAPPNDAKTWSRSAIAKLVREAVADLVRTDASNLADSKPVMDMGLTSNLAVALCERLSKEFDLSLPATFVFEYTTIRDMAEKGIPAKLHGGLLPGPPLAMPLDAATPLLGVVAPTCRIPRADSLAALWAMLDAKVDAVTEVPISRWDVAMYFDESTAAVGKTYARHGGFVDDVDLFDAAFFGMPMAEAKATDPQQRLLLSEAHESLREYGHDMKYLEGRSTGIFVGLSNVDWYHMNIPHAGTFTGPGASGAIASNRISYVFGLRGPSMTIDTACSSSLSALSAASCSLRGSSSSREALVAGCELLLGPTSFIVRSVAGMLSRVGRCQTFNATADGYIRGEGCGAMVVGRLEELQESACAVSAEVKSVVVNQDGKSATLTAPNGSAQEELMMLALAEANIEDMDVVCIECHGTGTALGDPIEVAAIRAALGATGGVARAAAPLFLTAGKSNHGHLEASAGLAGMLKAVACLGRKEAPPNVHFSRLNPKIHIEGSRIRVLETTQVLPVGGAIGVSSFGFGGTNTHALFGGGLSQSPPRSDDHRVAFLFTGLGSEKLGMGRRLYQADVAFHDALDRCADLCQNLQVEDLLDVMFASDVAAEGKLKTSVYSLASVFCVEYALAELWRAKGVRPFAVLGHSVGEYVAAVVAGTLSLEDGLRMVVTRGKLIDENCEPGVGGMAALFASQAVVSEALANVQFSEGESAVIAAINGPEETVVSGHKAAVAKLCATVEARSHDLAIPYAMHSPLLAPILPSMLEVAESCSFLPPSETKFVSVLTGDEATTEVTEPHYWVGHDEARPMLFKQGMQTLERLGCTEFLEVGPAAVLTKLGRRCATEAGLEWLATMHRDRDEVDTVLVAARMLGVPCASVALKPASIPWNKTSLNPLPGERKLISDGAAFEPTAVASAPSALQQDVREQGSAANAAFGGGEKPSSGDIPETARACHVKRGPTIDEVRKRIFSLAQDVIGEDPPVDEPLLAIGMDSLSSVEFRNRLSADFSITLPGSLIFDYPTLQDIIDFVTPMVAVVGQPERRAIDTATVAELAEMQAEVREGLMKVEPPIQTLKEQFGVGTDQYYLKVRPVLEDVQGAVLLGRNFLSNEDDADVFKSTMRGFNKLGVAHWTDDRVRHVGQQILEIIDGP